MKQFGGIERDKRWEEAYLFRVKAQGDLEAARRDLDELSREQGLAVETRKVEHEREQNEILGSVRGDHEYLRQAQSALRARGWSHEEGL
jgi:hypothetical protein